MATLVNGNGNVAVYAQQDADLLTGALGASTRIMNVGSKMAYTIEDANTIAVADGVILTKEGRRIQVDVGNVDEFTIPTGSAGVTRYYIIGYHLYTDGSANQKCETFVQLMSNGSETITENTFRNGASEVYVSLYRVKQIGLNLDTITALLSVGIALTDMTDVIGDTDISGIGDGTLTGGLNAVNQNLTELNEVVPNTASSSNKLATMADVGNFTILYENPNPSSAMADNVTLTLSSDDYDMLLVVVRTSSLSNVYGSPTLGLKGFDLALVYRSEMRVLRYVDNTHYRTDATTTSSDVIPLYILGMKL